MVNKKLRVWAMALVPLSGVKGGDGVDFEQPENPHFSTAPTLPPPLPDAKEPVTCEVPACQDARSAGEKGAAPTGESGQPTVNPTPPPKWSPPIFWGWWKP